MQSFIYIGQGVSKIQVNLFFVRISRQFILGIRQFFSLDRDAKLHQSWHQRKTDTLGSLAAAWRRDTISNWIVESKLSNQTPNFGPLKNSKVEQEAQVIKLFTTLNRSSSTSCSHDFLELLLFMSRELVISSHT